MKTYRNEKLSFKIDVPDHWSIDQVDKRSYLLGKDRMLIFECGLEEGFNFQVGPIDPEPLLIQTELEIRKYTQDNDFIQLEFGRITVEGKEHIWTRYYLGHGRWAKKYIIVLSGMKYAVTATCHNQKMLVEMEKAWDATITSFQQLSSPASVSSIPSTTPKAPPVPTLIYRPTHISPKPPIPTIYTAPPTPPKAAVPAAKPANVPLRKVDGKEIKAEEGTLTFSLISYALIALFAGLYIHYKVGFDNIFSFTEKFHPPLSVSEFNFAMVLLIFGVGALVCFMFLFVRVINNLVLKGASAFSDFVETTMQVYDKQTETLGGFIFSDYTRSPHGLLDGLLLQITNIPHTLIKLFTLLFSIVLLPRAILIIFGILFVVPPIILKGPLPMSWYAAWFLSLFYFCYRAVLFQNAKRKGVAKTFQAKENFRVVSSPSLESSIQSISAGGVTPEFIEQILCQENVINTIKNDLLKTDKIGYRETWRLGLITPDQDLYDVRLFQVPRRERVIKYLNEPQSRLNMAEQLSLKRTAILRHSGMFDIQFNNLMITYGRLRHPLYPGWSYRLGTKMYPGEFIRLRDIKMDMNSPFNQNRSQSLLHFLQEDGFPLKSYYADGDPLTTERGGIIVIDHGKVIITYPKYFVQRRLIDDEGNLVDIGLDESFALGPVEVKMQPAVLELLVRHVESHGYLPILRYRSLPYASDFMLSILDTPFSDSGWADLIVDSQGKARLFIAKNKTLAEWYEMMNRLRALFYAELAKKDYHFLGLTKDKTHLNDYLFQKQEILKEYYIIQNWKLY